MSAQEDALHSLVYLEASLDTLSAAETKLSTDLESFRLTMTPLYSDATCKICGSDKPCAHLVRLFLADSYLAQEHMRNAVRHTHNAYQMARTLKKLS